MEQTQVFGTDRTMVIPNDGATMQMPAGGATVMGGNDPMRTQMGGVATCAVCSANTPLMETYCGECGFLLTSSVGEEMTPPSEEAPVAELVDIANGKRYRLKPGVNTVGRMGTDVLMIDNTVSRNHATITVEGNTITVEDLGSSNGTKVGDTRLGANQPTVAMPGTPLKFGNWRVTLETGKPASPQGSNERTVMTSPQDRTMMAPAPSSEVSSPIDADLEVPGEMEGTNSASISTPENTELAETPINVSAPIYSAPIAKLQKIEGMSSDIEIEIGTMTIGRKPGNNLALPLDTYISGRHAEILADTSGVYLTDVGSTNGTVVNGQRLTANVRQTLLEGDEVQLGQTRFKFVSLRSESASSGAMQSDSVPFNLSDNEVQA